MKQIDMIIDIESIEYEMGELAYDNLKSRCTLEYIRMNAPIANAFQALVYRLEAQIARTETRLAELRAQLEASRKLSQDGQKGK